LPLPNKKPYEKLAQYLNRCIPVEISAGKTRAAAAAICTTNYQQMGGDGYYPSEDTNKG
tara:strand:- start:414 stop:590 length:177 start_codon:yes stop_codon:yes gene_type:complete